MTNRIERQHSRRHSRSLRNAAGTFLYDDALVDAAEALRQMELNLQEVIAALDQYSDLSADLPFEDDENDFNASLFERSSDGNILQLLQLLHQLSASREFLERKNAIEI